MFFPGQGKRTAHLAVRDIGRALHASKMLSLSKSSAFTLARSEATCSVPKLVKLTPTHKTIKCVLLMDEEEGSVNLGRVVGRIRSHRDWWHQQVSSDMCVASVAHKPASAENFAAA
jgi:hypothetical protein